jgi:hypothetical protein
MYHPEEVGMFYTYVLGYMILYMPTTLVNSVAFKQMKDPEKNFQILEFGELLGWILAGLSISYIFHWDSLRRFKDY